MTETLNIESTIETENWSNGVADLEARSDPIGETLIDAEGSEQPTTYAAEESTFGSFSSLYSTLPSLPTLWHASQPILRLSRRFMPRPLLMPPPSLIEKGAEAIVTSIDVYMNADDDKGLSDVVDYWSEEATDFISGLDEATGFSEEGLSLSGLYNGARYLNNYDLSDPFGSQYGFGYDVPYFDFGSDSVPQLSSGFGKGWTFNSMSDETNMQEEQYVAETEEEDPTDYLADLTAFEPQEEIPSQTQPAWLSSSTTTPKQDHTQEPDIALIEQPITLSPEDQLTADATEQGQSFEELSEVEEVVIVSAEEPQNDSLLATEETQTAVAFVVNQSIDEDGERDAEESKVTELEEVSDLNIGSFHHHIIGDIKFGILSDQSDEDVTKGFRPVSQELDHVMTQSGQVFGNEGQLTLDTAKELDIIMIQTETDPIVDGKSGIEVSGLISVVSAKGIVSSGTPQLSYPLILLERQYATQDSTELPQPFYVMLHSGVVCYSRPQGGVGENVLSKLTAEAYHTRLHTVSDKANTNNGGGQSQQQESQTFVVYEDDVQEDVAAFTS